MKSIRTSDRFAIVPVVVCVAAIASSTTWPKISSAAVRPQPAAAIADCSVHQPIQSQLEADRQIDGDVTGSTRAILRDLLASLPATRGTHDIAFFDGAHLYVNHRRFASTVRVWTPISTGSNLYESNRGEYAPFPADADEVASSSVRNKFVAPIPGDGGARNRYSNVGFSWNCAFVDTTNLAASLKGGAAGELGYAYEGGYAGINGNSYTTSTDAGLQIQPNHPGGGNIAAYLLEKPGTQNKRRAITGGSFALNAVFRVTAHAFIGTSGTTYVDTTVEGMKSDGSGVGTTDIALIADPAWNVAGTNTVVKRVTSIGQTIPGACGQTAPQCRLDGSYLQNVHWSDAYVGVNAGSTREPWTASQGNGFLCIPDDSRVSVAYVNPASETDSISLTTPVQHPCTE